MLHSENVNWRNLPTQLSIIILWILMSQTLTTTLSLNGRAHSLLSEARPPNQRESLRCRATIDLPAEYVLQRQLVVERYLKKLWVH